MSFISKEPTTFINIKLTDTGRRMASIGQLEFKKAVLSDKEVDYSVDRSGYYNIFDNRVLSPSEYYPNILPLNMDNSPAFNLQEQNVIQTKQIVTASTLNYGFFSGDTSAWTLLNSNTLGKNHITASNNTTNFTNQRNQLVLDNAVGSTFPSVGDLLFVTYPHDTALNYMNSNTNVPMTNPAVCCWYKITSANTPTVFIDRPPTRDTASWQGSCFIYKTNAIESYYGSGATQFTKLWNMNIVRTHDVAGSNTKDGITSGYTTYGSIEFNGTRRFFGFSSETPAVGFIHYTNEFTGNTYAEQLMETTVQVNIPMIMWHHKSGEVNGSGTNWGITFSDYYGQTIYDNVAKTTYRELRDSISGNGLTVGRVYHKMKLIVITDQELLTALSYKSNRNYTYPDFTATLTNKPQVGLAISGNTGYIATGYVQDDYDYFVTYIPESSGFTSGSSVKSFGNPIATPCGYIKKIKGQRDSKGNNQFIKIDFPNPDSFPYMRNPTTFTSLSNGWNANSVQILINRQRSSANYNVGSVPSYDWVRVSDANVGGNGVYRGSDYSDATINPSKLNSYSFVISQEDVTSGSTFTLYTGITTGMNYLTFGSETFFHGIISADIMATTFKSSITVYASDNDINSSVNPSFNTLEDSDTYVTEIAILDSLNQVVAVGKPTYPIKKRNKKYLAFKLELDF